MSGRTRNIAAVAAALAVAAVAIALVTAGGGHHGTTPTQSAPKAARPAPIRPRGPREGLRRGHGGRPDEPARGTAALLGIADQKPSTFSDPRFRALGVHRTRLNTPWNSIFTEPGRLAAWLDAARAAGLEPLVAFEHARGDNCPGQPCPLPPLGFYERAFRAFRVKYPWVKLIQPWNEANSSTQPTGTHPEAAAAYYRVVTRVCPSCNVPAADLLDSTNLTRWVARFEAALQGPVPRLWGLHNYSDVNRFRDTGTRRLLAAVPGEVWLTETGGIVSFVTSSGHEVLPPDVGRAARAIRYMLALAARFPRIKRIYVYQWKIDFPGNRFDAGLVGADGSPRPALKVLEGKRELLR